MPSAAQLARLIAPSYSVEHRYYTSALDYNDAEFDNINVNEVYSPSGDWTEITGLVIAADYNDLLNKDSAYKDWTVNINGDSYDSTKLAPEMACLAMRRYYDGTWSSWVVWWTGWFASMPGVKDDFRSGGLWAMRVESLSLFTRTDDCVALRFGKTNIASGKSVTVSGTLGSPMLEAGNGEYLGYSYAIDASDAVDGNMDTLWISEDAPSGTAETPSWPGDPPNYAINEVFYWPVGFDYTYGWIEVFCRGGQDDLNGKGVGIQHWYLYSASTGYTLDFAKSNISEILKSGGVDEDGNTIYNYLILCYDERKFRYLFDAGDAPVVEWRNMVCTDHSPGSNWGYDPTDDVLADSYTPLTTRECVVMGAASGAAYSGWSGASVPTPARGSSIRRNPAGTCASANHSEKTDFIEEKYPSPGHHKVALPAGWEWIAVDCGQLSFALEQELAPADTTLYTVAGTAGLTVSGQILMDGDILTYNDRTSTTLTVPAGVRVNTYPATTVFEQYENGLATSNWLINEVGWLRPYIVDDTTPRVPAYFQVYTSKSSSPVYPPANGWKNDWEIKGPWVGGYAQSSWKHTIFPGRYRHIMVVIREMSDEGRAKINELEIHPAYWTVTGGGNPILANGMIDDIFRYLLTTRLGLRASQISVDYNAYVGPFDTRQAKYHTILTQLAKQAGLVVVYGRDATISIVRDPTYPMHSMTETTHDWTKANMQDFQYKKEWPRIRQVEVNAYNPVERRTYTVRYPKEPSSTGELVTLPTQYTLGSQQAALDIAKAEFIRLTRHNSMGAFKPVGPTNDWLETLQRHRITWDLDDGGTEVESLFLTTSVSVRVDGSIGNNTPYSESIGVMEYAP